MSMIFRGNHRPGLQGLRRYLYMVNYLFIDFSLNANYEMPLLVNGNLWLSGKIIHQTLGIK